MNNNPWMKSRVINHANARKPLPVQTHNRISTLFAELSEIIETSARPFPSDFILQGEGLVNTLRVNDSKRSIEEGPCIPEEIRARHFNSSNECFTKTLQTRLVEHIKDLPYADPHDWVIPESSTVDGTITDIKLAPTLEDALEVITNHASGFGARNGCLFFVNLDEKGQPEGLTLSAVWYKGEPWQVVPLKCFFLLEEHPGFWNFLKDPFHPRLLDDVLLDTRLTAESSDYFSFTYSHAAVVLPLTVASNWVGILFIFWENTYSFSLWQKFFYESLLEHAAAVISNFLLLDQGRKYTSKQQVVDRVCKEASKIQSSSDMLQKMADIIRINFELDNVRVYQVNPLDFLLQVVAKSSISSPQADQKETPVSLMSDATAAKAARKGRVILANYNSNEPDISPSSFPLAYSEIAVPIFMGNNLLGVLSLMVYHANGFSREDGGILTPLSFVISRGLQEAQISAELMGANLKPGLLDNFLSAFSDKKRGLVSHLTLRKLSALFYLLAIAFGEGLIAWVEPKWGLVIHGLVLVVLLLHTARSNHISTRRFLLALSLAPLSRLLSLTLPLQHFEMVYWYLLIGAPLFLAAFYTARVGRFSRQMLGLRVQKMPIQMLVGMTGIGLGYLEYLILRPNPLFVDMRLDLFWLSAVIILVFTGLLEEFIFRGLMQSSARARLGRYGIYYSAVVFAVMHLGFYSWVNLIFVFLAALYFGWVALRSGSIIGVSLAHGLTNICSILVFPLLDK